MIYYYIFGKLTFVFIEFSLYFFIEHSVFVLYFLRGKSVYLFLINPAKYFIEYIILNNIPDDFNFVEYNSIWAYSASPVYKKDIQIDIFARAEDDQYTLIGEVKNRKAKFSLKEAKEFLGKALEVQKLENIDKAVVFVFSASGFFKNTLKFLKDNEIAWSDDLRMLDLSRSR